MAFNQFKIQAGGVVLETYDDFEISLNYQITDITDITSRKTSFSKTIVIPGTPINNAFFHVHRIGDHRIGKGCDPYNLFTTLAI